MLFRGEWKENAYFCGDALGNVPKVCWRSFGQCLIKDHLRTAQIVCIEGLVGNSYRGVEAFWEVLGFISLRVSKCYHWLHEDEKSSRISFQPIGAKDSCLGLSPTMSRQYQAFWVKFHRTNALSLPGLKMRRRNIRFWNREQSTLIFAVFTHNTFSQTQTGATIPLNTFTYNTCHIL